MRILHTMLRVGDLERSVTFYTQVLGMTLLRTLDNPTYSYTLAFLGYEDEMTGAALELTYNWGVNTYELGSAFGHIAIGVQNLYQTCDLIKNSGHSLTREPGPVQGGTTHIAFLKDPDGYVIELIQNKCTAQIKTNA